MGSRKSIIREAIERLDSLMAIGESRFQAKQAQRAASPDSGLDRFHGQDSLAHHAQSLPAACAGLHQLGTNHITGSRA